MTSRFYALWITLALIIAATQPSKAAGYKLDPQSATDRKLVEYFERETRKIEDACLSDIRTIDDWKANRERFRKELFEMLSLSPLPERTELMAQVTGKTEHPQFTVEKLHFQSLPGLYVIANLYIPKGLTNPAPTILYLSGHGPVISNGVSYGNKVTYQHHGAWFARNGYICMILDTLQLAEIQGLHHGTHREGMWWWNSRGYTPAGVEAWNSIRALDYLETRKEVDAKRFGVTGRSGGGAYSWWLAALDDRIKAAAPVAGITDLHNHVVDGVVEGHCDCMFIVNTYRWDYPLVAALVAPRPLLICNTDSDGIFPLDGVLRVHTKVRRIYELHNAANKLGLLITEGPHKDTQDLQVPVFRWFNRHLKGEEPLVEMAATKLFQPQDLRVFEKLPTDSVNTNIHDSFVAAAKAPEAPKSRGEWEQLRNGWLSDLKEKAFRGWPADLGAPDLKEVLSSESQGLRLRIQEFESQPSMPLRLYSLEPAGARSERVVLSILQDEEKEMAIGDSGNRWPGAFQFDDWARVMRAGFAVVLGSEFNGEPDAKAFAELQQYFKQFPGKVVFFAPRGIGPNRWAQTDRKQVQIRRRFMLLGQTVDSMRAWDIRRAIQAVQKDMLKHEHQLPLWIEANGDMAVNCLYASLFEGNIARMALSGVPSSHSYGPDYLNVMRILDIQQTVALAAERVPLQVEGHTRERWEFARKLAENLGWPKEQFVLIRRQL
jgi:dienelactone hydrolase